MLIGYCKLCRDKVIIDKEIQDCKCGNLVVYTTEDGKPESVGGNAVIILMDEDRIIELCEAAGLFEEDKTIFIDPTFEAKSEDKTYRI